MSFEATRRWRATSTAARGPRSTKSTGVQTCENEWVAMRSSIAELRFKPRPRIITLDLCKNIVSYFLHNYSNISVFARIMYRLSFNLSGNKDRGHSIPRKAGFEADAPNQLSPVLTYGYSATERCLRNHRDALLVMSISAAHTRASLFTGRFFQCPASASPTGNDFQQPTLPYNEFSANGNNPHNSVSQPRGLPHPPRESPSRG